MSTVLHFLSSWPTGPVRKQLSLRLQSFLLLPAFLRGDTLGILGRTTLWCRTLRGIEVGWVVHNLSVIIKTKKVRNGTYH